MKKRVIIIHRWGGKPSDDWYPWLKWELEKAGHEILVPEMPNTEAPVIREWLDKLKEVVGKPDENTILIGHSIGCQTIIRFLETPRSNEKAGEVLLVAPWIHLVNLEDQESEMIAKPWTETPIDWEKAKKRASKYVCLFSENDPWVPVEEAEIFKNKLGAEVKILSNQGHFNERKSEIIFQEILKQ